MGFEEADQCGEQGGLGGALAKLACADSGQLDEPVGPPAVTKRCRERGEGKCPSICWRSGDQSLTFRWKLVGFELAKILIVEDNALNIKLFCDLLAAHGHEPEAVTDSRNALDAARSFSPDLVITDIQLPHVSGFELIRMIRGDETLAEVPIMAVTAYSAHGDEERIRAAGAQAYVSKPISVARFAQTVDELLNGPAIDDPTGEAQESWANESDGGSGPQEPGGEEL